MQQILTLESAFAISLVILEIPSGYFADLYGRKRSLIIGSFIEVIGIALFVFSNTFEWFLLGEIIIGIGSSFCSGAGEALLYDSLLALKEEPKYKKIQGNMFFYGRMAAMVSTATGAMFAAVFLRLPFYITLIPYSLLVLVNLTLTEPPKHKSSFEKWGHFVRILKESFHDQKLKYFLIYAALSPAFFIMAFWLYQSYMEFIELPIFYFGITIAIMNISSGLCAKYAKEIEEWFSPQKTLFIVPALGIGTWLILANVKSFWAIPLLLVTSGLWGFFMPLYQDFIQKMTTSDRRATVISIRSFLTRGLFFIFAPFLGWITDVYDIQSALLMAAFLLFILSSLSLLGLKKAKII